MNIRTTNELQLAWCDCPCQPPTCDAPTLSCQSIWIEACGYTLPTHPSLSADDTCKLYKLKQSSYDYNSSEDRYEVVGDDEFLSSHQDITDSNTTTAEKFIDGSVCRSRYRDTTLNYSNIHIHYPLFEGDEGYTDTQTIVSSSTLSGGCHGTLTLNGEVEEFNSCPTYNPDPDETWTCSGQTYTRTLTSGDLSGDFIEEEFNSVTYSSPVTIEDLTNAMAATVWEDDLNGSECFASVTATTLSSCSQVTGATKVRYRVGVPSNGSYLYYQEAHDAYEQCQIDTPGLCGDEPIERHYFEAQWQEYFFTAAYDKWVTDTEEYEYANIALSAWNDCEQQYPGECGDAPIIPPEPGEEPTGPTLVASREWTYTGGNPFSDWFTIEPPLEAGQIRVVNMMTRCHKSSRLGSLPTSHGEIVEEEEEDE